MMNKARYKKYLPFLCLCILAFVPQEMMAQTFRYPQIFDFWSDSSSLHPQMLKKKGFSEVYSGPKKQGGFLSLYHNKQAQEYLFINYTDSGKTTTITYYLPTKAKYLNLQVEKKNLKAGEEIKPFGTTTYNDGKKYYQIGFMRSIH
ncbi:hypothetical protein [Pedobacter gandavensis]|uniref:Uncharacterized protein n=1 Tax=Pedobacter gandavensis TaxID=2679963 RepID=A0ABR6ESS9_9SPHI|nr:hypothetical protein [Pedobacter gandavensis]MBB2148314.1 hypothetical protein [Pedobacter gandavensis]